MNGIAEQAQIHKETHEVVRSRKIVSGSTVFEGAGGVAAIVLAIVALAGILQMDLMAIAVLAVGVALLFEGGAVGARFSRLLTNTSGRVVAYSDLAGGMTAEFMAGAVGIVLGILALIGIASEVLLSIAIVMFGCALLIGSGALSRLSYLELTSGLPNEGFEQVARDVVSFSSGAQVLTGLGAIILGILSLAGLNPPVLTLAALLSIGVMLVMNGSAIGSRISRLLTT